MKKIHITMPSWYSKKPRISNFIRKYFIVFEMRERERETDRQTEERQRQRDY